MIRLVLFHHSNTDLNFLKYPNFSCDAVSGAEGERHINNWALSIYNHPVPLSPPSSWCIPNVGPECGDRGSLKYKPSTVSPGWGIQVCEVFCLYSSESRQAEEEQARIQTHGNIAAQAESCPARSTAAQDKLGWTLSTEVRVRRRGHSTHTGGRREERGERDIWKIA